MRVVNFDTHFRIRLDAETKAEINDIARRERVPVSEVVRAALRRIAREHRVATMSPPEALS